MKKKILSLLCLVIILISSFSFISSAASTPLDEILYYEITVDPRTDGTLDMNYKIKWKVLDSTSEGPLEWIKVGVPNSHVDNIVSLSNNIDEIRYYQENEKHYIRVNFNQIFSKDDTIKLQFSIHQFDMGNINLSTVSYNYCVINNFSNTDIKELVVLWNSKNVLKASSPIINSDSFYIWNSNLKAGFKTVETIIVSFFLILCVKINFF